MTKRSFQEEDLYCLELFSDSPANIENLNIYGNSKSSLPICTYSTPLLSIVDEQLMETTYIPQTNALSFNSQRRSKRSSKSVSRLITKIETRTCTCRMISKNTWSPDITFLNQRTLQNMKVSVRNDIIPFDSIGVSYKDHKILTQWMWEVVKRLNAYTKSQYHSVYWISVCLMDKYFSG